MRPIAEISNHLSRLGQSHVLAHWDTLSDSDRAAFARQLSELDFDLADRLIRQWIRAKPELPHYATIEPVPVIDARDPNSAENKAAYQAGEQALADGRIGLVLVAGGQGTRLGFDGPKGAYPIGTITGRTIFEYHADKIDNLQRRYGRTLPWYIMVGETNESQTIAFFQQHGYFGLDPSAIRFFRQRMMPCVSDEGKLLLEAPGRLASNPNGHGGCIPALVENGITADARARGVDTLSYFQVDNWAAKVADPLFIGHHVTRRGQMSSKIVRKVEPRESVGVHCVCDGVYQVIEYTELDFYPQLLETDAKGELLHFAANCAIHILDVDFVEEVNRRFDEFPWHCSHKKIPFIDDRGTLIQPQNPNGWKFETFVFDALRYTNHAPIVLEIDRLGEYTPTKQVSGPNSVEAAQSDMSQYWGAWLEAAGCPLPHDAAGRITAKIEISPRFALTVEEFLSKTKGRQWPASNVIVIGPDGRLEPHAST